MNATRFWALLLVLVFVAQAHAIVVDFNVTPATYNVGNSFALEGIQFNVIPYNGAGSLVRLDGTGFNKYLSMGSSIGISVDLPSNTSLIEFEFGDFCGQCSTTGITVNGVASVPTVQLTALDGTMLGGVEIDVILGTAALHTMRLTGPITSFATGGTEYRFDNLRIAVPEPASCLLIGASLVTLILLRLR